MNRDKVKEITQDLANAIIRGDTMVPVCNVGPLLEYIEELEMSLAVRSNCCLGGPQWGHAWDCKSLPE